MVHKLTVVITAVMVNIMGSTAGMAHDGNTMGMKKAHGNYLFW